MIDIDFHFGCLTCNEKIASSVHKMTSDKKFHRLVLIKPFINNNGKYSEQCLWSCRHYFVQGFTWFI